MFSAQMGHLNKKELLLLELNVSNLLSPYLSIGPNGLLQFSGSLAV
tara:strand:+ start:565 stop:702 length:138 start_codon:yes stop_codon:yes gene_type:complete